MLGVNHHKDVGRTIEEYKRKGWLFSYKVAGMGAGPISCNANHYLLFERD